MEKEANEHAHFSSLCLDYSLVLRSGLCTAVGCGVGIWDGHTETYTETTRHTLKLSGSWC